MSTIAINSWPLTAEEANRITLSCKLITHIVADIWEPAAG